MYPILSTNPILLNKKIKVYDIWKIFLNQKHIENMIKYDIDCLEKSLNKAFFDYEIKKNNLY